MGHWRSKEKGDSFVLKRRLPIVELLEPRVLYSADSAASVLPLLMPDDFNDAPTYSTALSLGEQSDAKALEELLLNKDAEKSVGKNAFKHVVFIDSVVPHAHSLVASINDDTTDVILIEPNENGLAFISDNLKAYAQLESIQIISHGSSGQLILGADTVTEEDLLRNRQALAGWSASLSSDADILLFGCDVAADANGTRFVDQLARLSDVDVAASSNLTGHANLGADWDLEYKTGSIESDDSFVEQIKDRWLHTLGEITVTDVSDTFSSTILDNWDTGILSSSEQPVSLREAVYVAQNADREDTIRLPGGTYNLTLDPALNIGLADGKSGDLNIRYDTIIVGLGDEFNPTIIHQDVDSERIFTAESGTLQFENVTLLGSELKASSGAAIYSQEEVIVTDSIVRDNQSAGNGGAISTEGDLTIVGSQVLNNHSEGLGGGIYAEGLLTIEDTLFANNSSVDGGGAAYASGQTLSVTDSRFSNNFTDSDNDSGNDGHGGAVAGTSDIELLRSSFDNNETKNVDAESKGGAVYHSGNGSLSVSDVTFTNNRSVSGGAVYTDQMGSVSYSTFVDNQAIRDGAALQVDGGNITVGSSIFSSNTFISPGAAGSELIVNSPQFVMAGAVTSAGFNLFDFDPAVSMTLLNTDLVNIDTAGVSVQLEALSGIDGSFVKAHALMEGSQAINAAQLNATSALDAQGLPRDEVSDIGASEFNSTASIVYWVDALGDIYRSDVGFSNIQMIHSTNSNPVGIAADNATSRLYWVGSNNTQLLSIDLDGDGGEIIHIPDLVAASSLAIDTAAGHLYIAFAGSSPRIDRYDLNNLLADPLTVVENVDSYTTDLDEQGIIINPGQIAINTTTRQLVWVEHGGNDVLPSIREMNLQAQTIGILADAASADSIAFNPEGTQVFWTETGTDQIFQYDFDTSTVSTFVTSDDDGSPSALTYAKLEDQLVWVSDESSKLTSMQASDNTISSQWHHNNMVNDVTAMRTSPVTPVPIVQAGNDLVLNEGFMTLIEEQQLSVANPEVSSDQLIYTVTQAPAHGIILVDESPATQFSQQDVDDDIVVYLHDGSETEVDHIELHLSDGSNRTDRFKYYMQITPVNDAPTLAISMNDLGNADTMALDEGGVFVFTPSLLMGADAETPSDNLTYYLASTPTAGVFLVKGEEATSFTGQELRDGQVWFHHDGSEEVPVSLDFYMEDGASENNQTGTVPLHFDFTHVNDAPQLTTSHIKVNENGWVVLDNQDLMVGDPDSDPGRFTFHLHSNPDHGVLTLDGYGELRKATDTFTLDDLNRGLVRYTPQVNSSNDEITTYALSFVVTDAEGENSEPTDLHIVLTGENNAPILKTNVVNISEGESRVLSIEQLSVIDLDSDTSNWVYEYRLNENSHGSISVKMESSELRSSEPNSDGYLSFSHDSLLDKQVVFQHDGSDVVRGVIDFRVFDGLTYSDTVKLIINVEPVNDTPEFFIDNNEIRVNEGSEYVFLPSDFRALDVDNNDEDLVIFYGTPEDSSGQIFVNGELETSFSLRDLIDGLVQYKHDGREIPVGGLTDEFGLRLGDGEDFSDSVTLLVGLNPVNDVPVISFVQNSIPINEQDLGGFVVGEVSYVDADADDVVQVTISDSRFDLIMDETDSSKYQLLLREGEHVDYEIDTNNGGGLMSLGITVMDTNEAMERDFSYAGVTETVQIAVEDVVIDPEISVDAHNEGFAHSYVFEADWIVSQDVPGTTLELSATLNPDSFSSGTPMEELALPPWLSFSSANRVFTILDPDAVDVTHLEVLLSINDPVGGETYFPITLKFDYLPPEEPEVEEALPVEVEEPVVLPPLPPVPDITPPEPVIDLVELVTPTEIEMEEVMASVAEPEEITGVESEYKPLDDGATQGINDQVDIHDLVKPLATFGSLELAILEDAYRDGAGGRDANSLLNVSLDNRSLTDIFGRSQFEMSASAALLSNALDDKDQSMDDRLAASKVLFGTSTGVSTGLSVGYLLWLIRGGTLMGSVLSSLPAWRFVDPLPVLSSIGSGADNDEESLASIVEHKGVQSTDQRVAASTWGGWLKGAVGWKH